MKKLIIAATLVTSVVAMATAALAHRPAPASQAKPDFAKALFEKFDRDRR